MSTKRQFEFREQKSNKKEGKTPSFVMFEFVHENSCLIGQLFNNF